MYISAASFILFVNKFIRAINVNLNVVFPPALFFTCERNVEREEKFYGKQIIINSNIFTSNQSIEITKQNKQCQNVHTRV